MQLSFVFRTLMLCAITCWRIFKKQSKHRSTTLKRGCKRRGICAGKCRCPLKMCFPKKMILMIQWMCKDCRIYNLYHPKSVALPHDPVRLDIYQPRRHQWDSMGRLRFFSAQSGWKISSFGGGIRLNPPHDSRDNPHRPSPIITPKNQNMKIQLILARKKNTLQKSNIAMENPQFIGKSYKPSIVWVCSSAMFNIYIYIN